MSSCEATLLRSLEEILGPTLAEAVGKSITELVPAASICILSQSIGKIGGDLAVSLHSAIENLANASTDKDRKHWIGILFALLVAALGAYLAPIFLQLISMGAAGLGAGGAALTILMGAAAGWWAGSELGGAGDFFNVKDKVEQLWGGA
ncbi:hypothetical protein BGX34_011972 [Mortierella sp. NVP85]|nr:hypothetical protein BGX34_011972 [Mortierella sp. NVP85]